MKPVFRFFVIALPTLVVGMAAGAASGIALYQKAFGSPEQAFAVYALNYAFLLGPTKVGESTAQPEDVVRKTYQLANSSLVTAGMIYERLDPRLIDSLARATRPLDQHPLADNDIAGGSRAIMAREARRCILTGGPPKEVQECVSRYVTDVLDNTCPGKNVPRPCSLPMAEAQINAASSMPDSHASR